MEKNIVPVIDLFAGPGGLGEGFSLYNTDDIKFKIALSIEKDVDAHRTLLLRAFFRQFAGGGIPMDYYLYIQGEQSLDDLFARWPDQAKEAISEAWLHELNNGDIAKVRKKVKTALGKFVSDNWVLIGGPPCQAYSLVGRSRMRNYKTEFENDERHFLYQHYLRIVAHLKPSIFIMENVKGLLTATTNGQSIFKKLLDDLEYPGEAVKGLDNKKRAPSKVEYDIYSLVITQKTYQDNRGIHIKKLKPQDYIIHAEKYGIPQRRHRVILLGVRKDVDPLLLDRLIPSEQVTVSDLLDDLPPLRSGITRVPDSWSTWYESLKEIIFCSNSAQIDKKTLNVMRLEFKKISKELDQGGIKVKCGKKLKRKKLANWFNDNNLNFVLNHQSKSHMKSDLWRYFYSACYYKAHKKSPLLSDYPEILLPDHKNVSPENTKFLDRFKVQTGGKPASTVTSHISQDGHFFIHHDPAQCRAWTVREAARIQTFPDNYFFEGNRTAQYIQVGNAVPPMLAFQIAEVVAKHILKINN